MSKKRNAALIAGIAALFLSVLGWQGEASAAESVKKPLSAGLPIELPQGEVGSVTVTDVSFYTDETVVKYRVEGKKPYHQAYNLRLANSDGELIRATGQPRMISDTPHVFTMKFPPVNRYEAVYVQTNQFVDYRSPKL